MNKMNWFARAAATAAVMCIAAGTATMPAVARPVSEPDSTSAAAQRSAATATPTPRTNRGATRREAAAVSIQRGGEQTVATATREERYWTRARMAAAVSADELPPQRMTTVRSTAATSAKATVLAKPAVPSRAVAVRAKGASFSAGAGKRRLTVPTTAGKLFFTYGGSDYVCSATSVNSTKKNLIMTAGHCVHSGPATGWHSNFLYVPAYHNGNAPFGAWTWQRAVTFQGWSRFGDFAYDQAFISVHPKNGAQLVNRVGGNGLTVGADPRQRSVRILGWPAERPFTGTISHYCDGRTGKRPGSDDATLTCAMNGGASGGPWLVNRINDTVGYVFAVTSRRTVYGPPSLLATPNVLAVKDLYRQMG